MGGLNETFVEKKDKDNKTSVKLGKIRIHQNAGEVHFHDDELKLKAAVPVAEWWKAWEKLRTLSRADDDQSTRWEWYDSTNETHLTVETTKSDTVIDANVKLVSSKYGDTFKELNSFTKK